MKPFEENLTYTYTCTVSQADLAKTMGSGNLPVLATPALVAWMENAAHSMLLPYMEENEGTVGTYMEIKHLKASLPAMEVSCKARLVQVDGRRFVFEIEAQDGISLIATARHERFLIAPSEFMGKAEKRKNGN